MKTKITPYFTLETTLIKIFYGCNKETKTTPPPKQKQKQRTTCKQKKTHSNNKNNKATAKQNKQNGSKTNDKQKQTKKNPHKKRMESKHSNVIALKKKNGSRDCLNGQLFQPVTCLYGQLSVTPLRFYKSFDSCITVSSQRGHGQPFYTPK